MKKYFKTIFYFIGSLLFLTLTIMFTLNAIFTINLWEAFFSAYYIVFIICLAFTTVLFTIKGVEHLINDIILQIKLSARKQERAQVKAERAEADKQEKIKALEQQLEELKKN